MRSNLPPVLAAHYTPRVLSPISNYAPNGIRFYRQEVDRYSIGARSSRNALNTITSRSSLSVDIGPRQICVEAMEPPRAIELSKREPKHHPDTVLVASILTAVSGSCWMVVLRHCSFANWIVRTGSLHKGRMLLPRLKYLPLMPPGYRVCLRQKIPSRKSLNQKSVVEVSSINRRQCITKAVWSSGTLPLLIDTARAESCVTAKNYGRQGKARYSY